MVDRDLEGGKRLAYCPWRDIAARKAYRACIGYDAYQPLSTATTETWYVSR
jgi:hypothetical protein